MTIIDDDGVMHKVVPVSVLEDIKAEIANHKLTDDELIDLDEDSILWGMKIAYDIVDRYKAESEE